MTDQNSDATTDLSAAAISRRQLLRGTTAAGLIGVGVPATSPLATAQQKLELPHRVTLRPGNDGEQVEYTFRVDGTVEATDSTGTLGYDTIDSGDEGPTSSTFVDGLVGGTIEGNEDPEDAYRFAGNFVITEYNKPIEVTLELNGSTTGINDGLNSRDDDHSTSDDSN